MVWTGSSNTTNRDLFSLDPFASPHNLDRELHSLLAQASSNLCDWFAESGSQAPLPDSVELPDFYPGKEGVSNNVLLSELKLLTEEDDWQFKFYKDSERYDYDLNTLQNVMAVSPLQYTNEVV